MNGGASNNSLTEKMDVVQDFCNNLIDSIPEGWIPAEWIADQDSRVNVGVTIASVGVLLTLTLLRWILSGSDDVQQETERTQAAASSSSMSSSWLSSKKKGATFTVSKVFNYPIKSCSVEHPQLEDDHFDRLFFNARGVANDRKWMIIDEQNRFITQRQQPRMVRIEPRIKVGQQGQDDVLELTAKGQGSITVIPAKESDGNIVDVEVWSSKLEAIDEGDEVADFLTQFLGTPARLVRASSNQNTSKRDFKYLPEHPNDEGVTPVPGVELKEKKAKGKSSSSSSSSSSGDAKADLLKQGKRLIGEALRTPESREELMEEAIDNLGRALEKSVQEFGEGDVRTAEYYYAYGDGLLMKVEMDDSLIGGGGGGGDDEGAEEEGGAGQPNAEQGEEEGDDGLAWEMLEVARVLYEKAQGKEKELAEVLQRLGDVSVENGSPDQAVEDYQKCLALREQVFAKDSAIVAATHYSVGLAYQLGKKYQEAEKAFENAVIVLGMRLSSTKTQLDEEKVKGEGERNVGKIRELAQDMADTLTNLSDLKAKWDESKAMVLESKNLKASGVGEKRKDARNEEDDEDVEDDGVQPETTTTTTTTSEQTGFDKPSSTSASGNSDGGQTVSMLVAKKKKKRRTE
eukprot:TRINITY_DN989_c0_g1_i6.p1 TRINITY_DN989_c0_g1~~TRINITY_DN989_c0_g1_i6.p1  ORF type:complete len:629 (-),score=259.61 TRINITY_DN989_c0_g1_i6:33-1919(-)